MRSENDQNINEYSETAEDASPATSASESEIMNRETPASKLWPFVGGVALGVAGGIAAALIADALTYGEGGTNDLPESGEKEMLALPEGDAGA